MIATLHPRQSRVPLLALAILISLSACGILPKREPISVYEPATTAPAASQWQQADWSLLVAKPVASAWLDSDRISVRPAAGAVQVYKGAAWSGSVPDMVQTALLRKLEDSGKIMSVARPGSGVRGQFHLVTELRSFESIYEQPGQPKVVIEIYAKLVQTGSGEAIAAHTFRETEAASAEDVPVVVDAFSRALDRISSGIAAWTLESGNAQPKAPSAR